MQNLFKTLREKLSRHPRQSVGDIRRRNAPDLQVVVPNSVVLPLPRSPRDEISVPASINGRDLSTGRL